MTDAPPTADQDAERVRDIEMATAAHRRLEARLDELISSNAFDVSAPSRLANWTRGHVLTHVTNSGDGHIGILDGAARGDVVAQYPHGVEGRNADIEAGATRPAAEQLDAFRESNAELESRWATSEWVGHGITPRGGQVAIVELPFFRMREVAIHHIDLGIGAEFVDLPGDYLRLELHRMEMLWTSRRSGERAPLPDLALALEPPQRLAWLMGRVEIEGLAPAEVF